MLPIACNVQRLEDTMRECWDDTTLESQLMTAFMRFQRTRRKAPLHEKFNRSEVMLIGAIMHLQMESEEPVTVSRLSQKLRVATPTVTKLLSAMEEKGIGRPSTYAPTISTIISRGYVGKEKKHLFPTELGQIVTDIM